MYLFVGVLSSWRVSTVVPAAKGKENRGKVSPTGNRTRVTHVRGVYPNQLDYRGVVPGSKQKSFRYFSFMLSF